MLAGGWVSQLVIAPGIFGRQESKPGRAARTHTEPSRTQNSGFRGNIFGHPCGTRPSGEVQFVTKSRKRGDVVIQAKYGTSVFYK